ncbi:hypothetical protein GCM10020001_002120 [Nonomuraea salmonea]
MPPPAPAASPKERRPQLRLDSTAAEIRKYRLAYAACLKEHGMPSKGPWNDRAERAARQACKSKEPLLPPELSPRTNPHYAKSVRKEVACLKAHGFDVHLTPCPWLRPERDRLAVRQRPRRRRGHREDPERLPREGVRRRP